MLILFLFLISVEIVAPANFEGPSHGKKIVCYMHNWSNYRKDLGQFSIEDIDPSLCTNVVYSFAALNETTHTIRSGDRWQDLETDYGKAGYRRVVALKELHPHLKVTISIGGWAEGSVKYSNMASTRANRDTFVTSVLAFLKEHNFDGLDMHWKFPTLRDGKPQDKANFVLLLKELKEAFAPYNFLLTAAFGAGKSTMEAAYDLPKINRHVDYIHLLSFDYHGAWDGVVGSNAPLRGLGDSDQNNLDFSVTYLINNGVTPNKIILGLPAFGRTFTLKDSATRDIEFGRTATEKVGFQGPYTTAENGLMGYNEICMELRNKPSEWSRHWDARSATAYIRNKEKVICYDSGRSVAVKVKMAVDRGLGGLMVWSLDTDDFRGLCPTEAGSFEDYSARVDTLTQDPRLPLAVKALSLPTGDLLRDTDYYYVSGSRLALRPPRRADDLPYNILRTANEAATLATAEKRIEDAMTGNPAQENAVLGKAGFRPDYTYNSRLGYWLKLHSAALDWHTARLTCHYEGAELASPLNSELSAALSELMATDSKSRWHYSGVHQSFGDGVYTTVRGVPLDRLYIPRWEVDAGASVDRARCLALSNGAAREVDCGTALPFVCYRKYCGHDRLTDCGTIDTEYKLEASTGQCYKRHAPSRWERAARVCVAEGGYLAVVDSDAEAAALARVGGGQEVAVGYRQWGDNNEWTTVQGKSLQKAGFTSWCEDCPSAGRGCGGLKAGRLAPLACGDPRPFICERAPNDNFTQNNLLFEKNVTQEEKPFSFASFIQERSM